MILAAALTSLLLLPFGVLSPPPAAGAASLSWNALLGGRLSNDRGYAIAVDANGNIYIAGRSSCTWGAPIRAFSGGYYDAFVAKLDPNGILVWNTFLGGGLDDWGSGISVGADGGVYVMGSSGDSWGTPIRDHGGGAYGAFVAELNGDGTLLWNTFLGGSLGAYGNGIAVGADGGIYVMGSSGDSWGTPIRPASGGIPFSDAFVAKLDGDGALLWNTFLGSASDDSGSGIAVDKDGGVYVTGRSNGAWGTPTRGYVGGGTYGEEAFVAKLDDNGAMLWNAFLGGIGTDFGSGIAVDASGGVYVTGASLGSWGDPIRAYGGGYEAFAAKFDGDGVFLWSTFLGGSSYDSGNGIAVGADGSVYITGGSYAVWGAPIRAYGGGYDGFVAKLDGSGGLLWNAFLGGRSDFGYGITVDANGSVYVTGWCFDTWNNEKTFFVVISEGQTLPAWRSGETDLGGGWKHTDWFGTYFTGFPPWVYHPQHGFLYPFDDGAGGVYFWYNDMGAFVWTNGSAYPVLYRFGATPSWLWYQKDSVNPRWFYNYAAGAWESLQ